MYRCDLNGKNVEVVIEKPVYYFTVFGNQILYQDDKDQTTLHIYDIATKDDCRVNSDRAFWPIFDGQHIYYLTDSAEPGSYKFKLRKMLPDGTDSEAIDIDCYMGGFLLRGDYVYYINMNDGARVYRSLKDGSGVELVTQDGNVGNIQWVKNSLVYMCMSESGYIDGIYICDTDGGNKIEFTRSNKSWRID